MSQNNAKTHTNSLVSQSKNPNVSQLSDIDYINIQKLLQTIKMPYRASKRKDAKIDIRVDQDTKLAWDIIVGHDRRKIAEYYDVSESDAVKIAVKHLAKELGLLSS